MDKFKAELDNFTQRYKDVIYLPVNIRYETEDSIEFRISSIEHINCHICFNFDDVRSSMIEHFDYVIREKIINEVRNVISKTDLSADAEELGRILGEPKEEIREALLKDKAELVFLVDRLTTMQELYK